MSSNVMTGSGPAVGPVHATQLVDQLEQVLAALGQVDLTTLTSLEHTQVLPRLVRAQHVLHGVVLGEVGAFDAAGVASTSRHRTTTRWLEHRARVSAGTASHLTQSARAVRDHLPSTREALLDGSISAQHASAIVSVVRTVGADHAQVAEPILLQLARETEPSVVRRATARIHALVDPEGAEKALREAYERRGVTLSVVGQHGYLDGVLDVESTELLLQALAPLMAPAGQADARSAPQRRADALVDLAKQSLDEGLGAQLGGERPHVSVVIDEAVLQSGVGSVTLPWTGGQLAAGAVRRWACDAQLTPVLARLLPPPNGGTSVPSSTAALAIGGGWLPLDVGRSARTVTTGQLKALRVRDGGCVHPGCSRTSAFCDAHHVQHWAAGGATALHNLVLLCRHHHRTLHDGLWSLTPDAGQPGLFWANAAGWQRPAQTAADRSPPVRRE
jgi:hypothetical protein